MNRFGLHTAPVTIHAICKDVLFTRVATGEPVGTGHAHGTAFFQRFPGKNECEHGNEIGWFSRN